jgi:hypothetical protein
MIYLSILTMDRERDPELWATMWQGDAPPGLTLHSVYRGGDRLVFVWEGDSAAELLFMERCGQVGDLETFPVVDRTKGWRLSLARDLDGLRAWMVQRGDTDEQIESALDLRSAALDAPNVFAARRAALEWIERQEDA